MCKFILCAFCVTRVSLIHVSTCIQLSYMHLDAWHTFSGCRNSHAVAVWMHTACSACRKQHNIILPGGVTYSAVDNSRTGAPLRPTTVQDAIGDLPPISNGEEQ
jgi:hypothetical protein